MPRLRTEEHAKTQRSMVVAARSCTQRLPGVQSTSAETRAGSSKYWWLPAKSSGSLSAGFL